MQAISVLFFWLIVGHAVADYPLQGDFLAKAKNAWLPIAGVPWWIAMTAHCVIHAGAVVLVTHSVVLGLVEFVLHFAIDVAKCSGSTNFEADQLMHMVCKLAFAVVAGAA